MKPSEATLESLAGWKRPACRLALTPTNPEFGRRNPSALEPRIGTSVRAGARHCIGRSLGTHIAASERPEGRTMRGGGSRS